jgi:NAD(P)H-dependent flavin oxidoreductase YrpB (nitropropane dioxygenase family)
MRTEICEKLGIEFPIFAFSHCRDVVAAVSKAGGMGVLGAVFFTVEELTENLNWIDQHVGDNPYGVDILIPAKYLGKGEGFSAEELENKLRAMIPEEHRKFANKILKDAGVPELPENVKVRELIGLTEETAKPLIDASLTHEKVRLIVNALGTPPVHIVKEIQDSGRWVAALCGSAKHALNHKAAGIDIVIANGTEAGGHTGDVGSIVLWPEVIDAVAPLPVLAAGGIGGGRQMAAALAMGAQGVWTGTIWVTTTESDFPDEQKEVYLKATSRDTVRTRSWSGKFGRGLRNDWTDAWDRSDTPDPLEMPLQGMVAAEPIARSEMYPAQSQPNVGFNPCGQIVGSTNAVKSVRIVIQEMIDAYLDAVERLNNLMPE